jgi:hypothetical protein
MGELIDLQLLVSELLVATGELRFACAQLRVTFTYQRPA